MWKRTKIKITKEIETEWIEKVINEKSSKRFAILYDDIYIGNVQLTDITKTSAKFHIFIGDKKYLGKGIGKLATYQILHFAQEELKLKNVNLSVKADNISAIKTYLRCGFKKRSEDDGWIKMSCDLSKLDARKLWE